MTSDTLAGSTYRTRATVGDTPVGALVIACSDGRYRRATNEFLSQHLELESWETIAVPGGAYMLSFAEALPKQLKLGMRMVKGAMRDRTPGRIIVIGHAGCARYLEGFSSHLKRVGFSLEAKQKRDLQAVARDLAASFGSATVEAYFARPETGVAVFERL